MGCLLALTLSLVACGGPRPVQSPEQKALLGVIARSTIRELRTLCKADDALACGALGRTIGFRGGEPRLDDVEARAALEKSCAAGEVWGCYWLGRFLLGSSRTDEWERGKAWIARACAGGLALCSQTSGATRHAGRSGVGPMTFQKVMGDYFEPRCNAGSATSCLVLGRELIAWEYSGARSEKEDFERASVLFRHGCELGLSVACLYEGYVQEASPAGAGGHDRAVAEYEKACRMGNGVGCKLSKGSPARAPSAADTTTGSPSPSASAATPLED